MGDPYNVRQKRFSVQSFQFIDMVTNTFFDDEVTVDIVAGNTELQYSRSLPPISSFVGWQL